MTENCPGATGRVMVRQSRCGRTRAHLSQGICAGPAGGSMPSTVRPMTSRTTAPVGGASRQVRRAATRLAQRHARRSAVHRDLPDPLAPTATGPGLLPLPLPLPLPVGGLGGPARPLFDTMRTWLDALLAGTGHSQP